MSSNKTHDGSTWPWQCKRSFNHVCVCSFLFKQTLLSPFGFLFSHLIQNILYRAVVVAQLVECSYRRQRSLFESSHRRNFDHLFNINYTEKTKIWNRGRELPIWRKDSLKYCCVQSTSWVLSRSKTYSKGPGLSEISVERKIIATFSFGGGFLQTTTYPLWWDHVAPIWSCVLSFSTPFGETWILPKYCNS